MSKPPPQGNHLHQRQGGGGRRQADTSRDEQVRQRAEPHSHRIRHPFSACRRFAACISFLRGKPLPRREGVCGGSFSTDMQRLTALRAVIKNHKT